MISKGQRYRAEAEIEVTCMTSWRAPYTGGYKRMLPAGEEFVISNDPLEKSTAIYADPVNYDKLHKRFVPLSDRFRILLYNGYYLCIDLRTIREQCRLLEEETVNPEIVDGDLLLQQSEVIVNPWNRNIIPWWLLLPQGVSGAIKKQGGTGPFRELARCGPIELGGARLTGPGRLPCKAIIHVTGINIFWLASRRSISASVRNAMEIVNREGFRSVAFPLIGSGSGNCGQQFSLDIMLETFATIESEAEVTIVRYRRD